MFPDSPHQDSAIPLAVPPVVGQAPATLPGQAVPQAYMPPLSAGLAPGADPAQVVAQAKQMVAQYGHDPARLSSLLQQLKQSYLAEHFHISIRAVEN
jgi:hypothetical protein